MIKLSRKVLVYAGIFALALGASIFILNYERQSIDIAPHVERLEILEYHAPTWDPFPHTVKITIDTSAPVTIVVTFSGTRDKTNRYIQKAGEELLSVHPGENLSVLVENTQSAQGTIQTVLWCDSWNYAAIIWGGIGVIILISSFRATLKITNVQTES
jgi:hypothetical protein